MSEQTRVGAVATAMSDSDALLWTLGRDPVLRTTIVAVLVLDGTPQWDEVRGRFEALTRFIPQLRSRVVAAPFGWGRPHWAVDDRFDLDVHLRRMVAPPPATLRTVLDLAQAMAVVGFDTALPPWEAVLVEGLRGGEAAIVVKFHHSIADGLGGMAAALEVLDDHVDTRGGQPRGVPPQAEPVGQVHSWPQGMASGVVRAASHPGATLRSAQSTVASVGKLLAPARRPLSPLWPNRSLGRRFEVLDLPTSALRGVAQHTETTVNDVFVTSVLGGLRRYHEQHGAAVERLRLLMPISVRDEGDRAGGNRFVPARFALTIETDPLRRLRHVHDAAQSWKHAPALRLNQVLAAGLDALPPQLVTMVWGGLLKGDDFVATNVPGPAFDVAIAGARLARLYAFSPPSGAALNVSLVTVAERACLGLNLDTAAVADGEVFRECLAAGFDEVLALTAVEAQVVA
ncbi:MAG TPA: wax ester/triacylglycerol synthase domain-containing protein [Acidimicrobiales bacterium]|nr:wax ester/triacylglycerol synthase domain-containing protein [Acidimicrobiales bacterium]